MVMLVELTQNMFAQVDDEDYLRVNFLKWYADKGIWTTYAKTDALSKSAYMHRFIMQPAPHEVINHIDGNGLNNTKANLEIVTQSINAAKAKQRSGKTGPRYRGVYTHGNGYMAQITINYRKYYLGWFKSAEEAALAYNKASLELRGPGFPLNEID